jgi:hypothetical protein
MFTEKERRACVRGKLHETMGFKYSSAPQLGRDNYMWNKPRVRGAYEAEISYQPPYEPPPGRLNPVEVASRMGAAGEPSHSMKMDQKRWQTEFTLRASDREMVNRT